MNSMYTIYYAVIKAFIIINMMIILIVIVIVFFCKTKSIKNLEMLLQNSQI